MAIAEATQSGLPVWAALAREALATTELPGWIEWAIAHQVVRLLLPGPLADRDDLVGVSLEEEMISLIRYQRGFESSAKFLSTVDEMMNSVLNLKQ